jgi:uncharacterized protein YfaP (DUF2135 family)
MSRQKNTTTILIACLLGFVLFMISAWVLIQAKPPEVTISEVERKIIKYKVKTGYLQISLGWHTLDDLDLILVDPDGQMLWYRNKKIPSGGFLDMDANEKATDHGTTDPLENHYFPNKPTKGKYRVYVNLYDRHRNSSKRSVNFEVRVLNQKKIKIIKKSISKIYKEWLNKPDVSKMVLVSEFVF